MQPNLEFAQLVGSYHAHRGACNEREFLHWWDSLTHTQRERVMWYQRDGVAVFDYITQYHTEPQPINTPTTMAEAFGALSAALFGRLIGIKSPSLETLWAFGVKKEDLPD